MSVETTILNLLKTISGEEDHPTEGKISVGLIYPKDGGPPEHFATVAGDNMVEEIDTLYRWIDEEGPSECVRYFVGVELRDDQKDGEPLLPKPRVYVGYVPLGSTHGMHILCYEDEENDDG